MIGEEIYKQIRGVLGECYLDEDGSTYLPNYPRFSFVKIANGWQALITTPREPNLTVGETVTLIITTIAQKEGIIVNNVSVNSTTVDLNMTNNFANATVEANEVIIPSDVTSDEDSSQSSELGLSQNKNNLLNSGIGMEKTGNPLMIALLLIICLIGFGVNSRRK